MAISSHRNSDTITVGCKVRVLDKVDVSKMLNKNGFLGPIHISQDMMDNLCGKVYTVVQIDSEDDTIRVSYSEKVMPTTIYERCDYWLPMSMVETI